MLWHLADAFSSSDLQQLIHTQSHTDGGVGATQGASQLVRSWLASCSRRLAQRHLDTRLGGDGDPTSNLPVTSQHPALPPEQSRPQYHTWYCSDIKPGSSERDARRRGAVSARVPVRVSRCVSPERVLQVVPPGQGDGAEEALDCRHRVQEQGLGQVLGPDTDREHYRVRSRHIHTPGYTGF